MIFKQEAIHMVITTLEAHVAPEKAAVLEAEFKQAVQKLDTGIVQTFLLRGARDTDRWQIVTVWESREALDAMRNSGETPRGVLILRAAGAEPALSVFGVVAQGAA
jgi:heme-degrading monooxygenase HmoA